MSSSRRRARTADRLGMVGDMGDMGAPDAASDAAFEDDQLALGFATHRRRRAAPESRAMSGFQRPVQYRRTSAAEGGRVPVFGSGDASAALRGGRGGAAAHADDSDDSDDEDYTEDYGRRRGASNRPSNGARSRQRVPAAPPAAASAHAPQPPPQSAEAAAVPPVAPNSDAMDGLADIPPSGPVGAFRFLYRDRDVHPDARDATVVQRVPPTNPGDRPISSDEVGKTCPMCACDASFVPALTVMEDTWNAYVARMSFIALGASLAEYYRLKYPRAVPWEASDIVAHFVRHRIDKRTLDVFVARTFTESMYIAHASFVQKPANGGAPTINQDAFSLCERAAKQLGRYPGSGTGADSFDSRVR